MLTNELRGPLVGFKVIDGVTVKDAVGKLEPSVAKTCLMPAVSGVMLKVAEKLPVEFAVTVGGFVVIKFPSKLRVIVELGTKFEPFTVTVVPSDPV